jgi:hypothetical protein
LIAREWKELDPAIKAPFIEKAANDRKRYENEKK